MHRKPPDGLAVLCFARSTAGAGAGGVSFVMPTGRSMSTLMLNLVLLVGFQCL
jgi:hypothetical protein